MVKKGDLLFEEVPSDGAPAAADAPTPPAESQPVDTKWSDLLADDDTGVEDTADGVEEAASTQEQSSAEATPPAEESKPTEADQAPAVQQNQEQPQAPKPQLTAEQVADLRRKFEEELAKRYTFSEDDTVLLQTEPEKILPKMAAKLQLDILETIEKRMQQSVPMMIQEYTQFAAREAQAQTQFYTAWPELRGYEQQVLQMGAIFRQMNPTAPPEEAIARIGKMTMDALGLAREQQPTRQAQAPSQQVFRPATPGGKGTPPPAKTKWEAVFDED